MFGSDLDIICSTSEHYCIPVFLFEHIDRKNKSVVLLSVNDMKSKGEKCSFKKVTPDVWTTHISKTYRATEKC